MTDMLQKAFAEAGKLSEVEQDRVAQWLLAELEDDRTWDVAFGRSSDRLAELASEALDDHVEGRTKPLDLAALKSRTTPRFRDCFTKLPEQIQEQARKAYRQFADDLNHPSLRFKTVHPT